MRITLSEKTDCGAVVVVSSEMRTQLFFFFSSRRRHTRFDCDWSSDVCSSDLRLFPKLAPSLRDFSDLKSIWITGEGPRDHINLRDALAQSSPVAVAPRTRSEERRVGKECRSRWSPYH